LLFVFLSFTLMAFAFNTRPFLPSDFMMTLPSMPTELVTSWSLQWRLPKPHSTCSSPSFERRKMAATTTLPPIAFLERHRASLSLFYLLLIDQTPVSPSEDVPPPHYSPPTRLAPLDMPESIIPTPVPEPIYSKAAPLFTETNNISVDWLDFTQKRSAHFIAEKTCEMICYLWFTTPPSPDASTYSPNSSTTSSLFNRPNSATTLQLVATPTFVSFMQKLLETTQVSQSVIVLSLHYIYRLKERNRFTPAQAGSEFRIAVAGLMMANKFLDE
jgi:hypothetical protein